MHLNNVNTYHCALDDQDLLFNINTMSTSFLAVMNEHTTYIRSQPEPMKYAAKAWFDADADADAVDSAAGAQGIVLSLAHLTNLWDRYSTIPRPSHQR
jgi:hypothetical protein